jgi:hypothetical protein
MATPEHALPYLIKGPRAVVNGSKGIKSALLKYLFILIMPNTLCFLSVSSRSKVVGLFLENCLRTYIDVNIFPCFDVGKLTPKTCLSILDILRITKYYMIYTVHTVVECMWELVYDQGISIKRNFNQVNLSKNFHLENRMKAGKYIHSFIQ